MINPKFWNNISAKNSVIHKEKNKVSPYTECKLIMGRYIDNTPNLPRHIKLLAKQHVFSLINLIPEYLGHLELLWRREKDN